MAVGRSGNKIQEKIQMCVWGRQGAGKSFFCMSALKLKRPDGKPMRILYLDAEQGSADSIINDYTQQGYNTENMWIVSTAKSSEIIPLINKAGTNDPYYDYDENGDEDITKIVKDGDGEVFHPDLIIVDSSTRIKQTKEEARRQFSAKRAAVRAEKQGLAGQAKLVAIEGSDLEQKDYKDIAFEGRTLVAALRNCGKHFIITARAKDKKRYELINGVQVAVDAGCDEIDSFKDLTYDVDTILHLKCDNTDLGVSYYGVVEDKDRSHVCDPGIQIPNISLERWQCIIDKSKGLPQARLYNEKEVVEQESGALMEQAMKNSKVDGVASNGTATNELDELKAKATNVLKSLTTEQKKIVKMRAEGSGLSTTISSYTSVEELNKLYTLLIAG